MTKGLIPRAFIDELLNRTDIVDLIDGYVPLKKRGHNYIACCPFHNEKTPSFNVVARKQFYHCFGCGASGNAISFLMEHLNLAFVETIETLATRLGLTIPRDGQTEPPKPRKNLYQLLEQITHYYQSTLKTSGHEAIHYLKARGLSSTVAERYQLGYAPNGWHVLEQQFKATQKDLITTGMLIQKDDNKTYDRYRHRIMFPIHDRHGHIIGFGGRAIDKEQQPKYLNSPETILFQKNRELYGLHQMMQQQANPEYIVIVEGYMDVIALAQHGVPNAVATLGTATSTHHIHLLSRYTKQLIFCFDGDKAGKQAAWRALESCLPHLNNGLEARFIFLPEGYDPDSLIREKGKSAFLDHIKAAIPLNDFFFTTLGKNINLSTMAGKSQLINAAKPHLNKMNDGPYKQLIIDELSRVTRIDDHRMNQLIDDPVMEKPIDTNVSIARSPMRLATALLLQHPEIYSSCSEHINPAMLDKKKHSVLQALIEQVANSPTANTATLIETWRNTSLFEPLVKLAAWDHQVPEPVLAKEFIEIVLFLTKQHRESKIQELLEKARKQGLTDSDRLHLQEMLKQRHERA